jgi:Flp pilus assembly protein TadD
MNLTNASPVAAATNNMAWLYAEQGGDLGMALALTHAAGERAPNDADVDHTLGWVYYQNGLPTLAIAALKRSVQKDPTNPLYFCHLALAYLRSGDWVSARQSMETAVSLRPGRKDSCPPFC